MNSTATLQHPQVTAKIKYLPAVSIILAVHQVITPKNQLEYRLKLITEKIERRLETIYSVEKVALVITKLKNLICGLDYDTHKRSIAIFVSPVVEKLYYVDAELQEKIAIDEFFEIRGQVFREKQTIELLSL